MTSSKLSILATAALLCSVAVQAAPLHNTTGLSGSFATENFDTNAGSGTLAASQFSGVTFSPEDYVNDRYDGIYPNMVNSSITNFVPNMCPCLSPTSLTFSSTLSEAAFAFVSNIQGMTFAAYLGGTLVESDFYTTDYSGDFYGFTGISFDKIVITGDGTSDDAYILDMLQTKAGAVPEPGMLALLGLAGLGAIGAARRRRAA